MPGRWIPDAGDIVALSFDPQSGHEQAGRRPALVLSPRAFNRIGVMICCPITTQPRGVPFEVWLPESTRTRGVILTQHVKSVDWAARRAERIETVPAELCREAAARVASMIGVDPN